MIKKETFKKVIKLVQEQEKIDYNFSKALETVCDTWCIYGTNNKYSDALFLLLEEIFQDKECDIISWWLYENVKKEIYLENGEVIEIKNLDDLYDYLVKNVK